MLSTANTGCPYTYNTALQDSCRDVGCLGMSSIHMCVWLWVSCMNLQLHKSLLACFTHIDPATLQRRDAHDLQLVIPSQALHVDCFCLHMACCTSRHDTCSVHCTAMCSCHHDQQAQSQGSFSLCSFCSASSCDTGTWTAGQ